MAAAIQSPLHTRAIIDDLTLSDTLAAGNVKIFVDLGEGVEHFENLRRVSPTQFARLLRGAENKQTGTAYTLALSDAKKLVSTNNTSANTFTVPTNAVVAFLIGTKINGLQRGAGLTTVVAAGGVTIRNVQATLKSLGQYATWSVEKIGTDEWVISGALAAT